MSFERVQKQTHTIANVNVYVSYDRFTTRFEIKDEKNIIFSSLLLFSPFRSAKINIGEQRFTLKIFWFILWHSKLVNTKQTVIKELLYRRRRKSIGLLIYVMIISSIKLGLGLLA